MGNLNTFAFESQALRVVMIDGEPWFVGKDVALVLGYTNHNKALGDHCKGVTKRYPLQTSGGIQEVRIISEPDMLRLAINSKLPAAERFERWVFEEVLPSIRKTGSYTMLGAPGAMGVTTQPMPYLSHVADFHVAADRLFRSVLRSARSSGMPLHAALRQANTVTQTQTGMDILGMLNAQEHLQKLEQRAATEEHEALQAQQAGEHQGVARFWLEWSGSEIEGLPYQSCLAAQAYQAYTHWCSLTRQGETARREAFTSTLVATSGQAVRVKVMRISEGTQTQSERMLLATTPPLEGQGAWATALVQAFAGHLRSYLAQRRKTAKV